MKKVLALIMVMVMVFSLCACGEGKSSAAPAKIVDNEGTEVEMTAEELIAIDDENSAKFDKYYEKAEITLTGTVKEVKSNVLVQSVGVLYDYIVLEEGWEVWMIHDSHEDVLLELSAGDTIEVSSQIYSTDTTRVKVEHATYKTTDGFWTDYTTITIK